MLSLLWAIIDVFGMWGSAVWLGFLWTEHNSTNLAKELIGGTTGLMSLLLMFYNRGYLGVYKRGRKCYFYIVFVVPFMIGVTGITTAFLRFVVV